MSMAPSIHGFHLFSAAIISMRRVVVLKRLESTVHSVAILRELASLAWLSGGYPLNELRAGPRHVLDGYGYHRRLSNVLHLVICCRASV